MSQNDTDVSDYHSAQEIQSEQTTPLSLVRPISPPLSRRNGQHRDSKSATAAVEAGEKQVSDHLAFYSSHLLAYRRPVLNGQPRLSHDAWVELYKRNAGSKQGHHFVIHQHDHPIAGTHYDLRLQCNPTSSISFAIMYGLPGNPNSRRLNRNATETRVHCLWNHLIETASETTGTMLLWDSGEYEMLPFHSKMSNMVTTDEDNSDDAVKDESLGEPEKLHKAFRERKLKMRLNGTRLPQGYTISLRLTKDNHRSEQPGKPVRKRQRNARSSQKRQMTDSSDSDEVTRQKGRSGLLRRSVSSLQRIESPPPAVRGQNVQAGDPNSSLAAASIENEDDWIRLNNAYPGATNDIGSVHQRRWFLSMDRISSGFTKKISVANDGQVRWVAKADAEKQLSCDISKRQRESLPTGFPAFLVLGRDVETSIVTGRLAKDILHDEGVDNYVPRGHWRAVTE